MVTSEGNSCINLVMFVINVWQLSVILMYLINLKKKFLVEHFPVFASHGEFLCSYFISDKIYFLVSHCLWNNFGILIFLLAISSWRLCHWKKLPCRRKWMIWLVNNVTNHLWRNVPLTIIKWIPPHTKILCGNLKHHVCPNKIQDEIEDNTASLQQGCFSTS